MRHLRTIVLCGLAAFAASAAMVTSALANTVQNPTNRLGIYKNCPVNGKSAGGFNDELCVFSATEAAPEGGAFTVGGITVPLEKQVQLQYGLAENSEGVLEFVAPTDGAAAIVPTPEKVPGEPIGHITEAEQEEEGWPAALKYSYKQAQKHGKVKIVYESIEQAGDPVQNSTNIIFEEGVGVLAPVKIKGENKWLSELGDVCYIGSEEDPITQHLTTGGSESPLTHEILKGSAGRLSIFDEGNALYLTGSDLVDNTYAVPGASCTGPYSSSVDAAIDKAFGIPAVAGASNTQLKGTLYESVAQVVKEKGIAH